MIKALLVDDEKLVRKGMIAIMPWKEFGIEVVGDVNSGEKALEFLQENEVNLLITDLSMPHMSGMELVRKVRNLYPDIAIVILTFHQDFEMIQDALRQGVIDYILKTQLEKEEMENILGRIVSKIRNDKVYCDVKDNFYGQETPKEPCKPAPEQCLEQNCSSLIERTHKLREKWHGIEWIFYDDIFEKLIAETDRLRPPAAVLETIFYSVKNGWEYTFPFVTDRIYILGCIERLKCWNDWLNWLSSVRKLIQEEIIKPQYGKDIVASIMKSIEYVNHSEGVVIKQEDVAKSVNMSRSYFSHCFKNIIGKSFNDYVREVKINKAKILLEQTQKPIYWIAEKLGYQDEKYFSRIFYDYTGMLPTEFRNKNTILKNV